MCFVKSFATADENGDQFLDEKELFKSFAIRGSVSSPEQIKILIEKFDLDNDGKV